MASNVKTEKPVKAQSEMVKRFKANPLVFVGTIIVLVIVITAFVLVPAFVPEARGASLDTTFGYYGNTPISFVSGNYFANVVEQYNRAYGSMPGYESVIWRQAFENAALRTAVLVEAGLSGYAPPDAQVDKAVAQLAAFQENGRFSAIRYRSLDAATRSRVWKEAQEGLVIQRYFSDLNGSVLSDKEKAFISGMAAKQRKFDAASFSINDYPASEVSIYIDAHPELFKTVHLSQISVSSSESDAAKVLEQVKAGTLSFEDAAKQHSIDSNASRGGDMGARMAYEVRYLITEDEARAKALSLSTGEISDVLKIPQGWGFFRAEEASVDADSSDEAVIEKARSYLMGFERGIIEDYWLAKAEEFAAAARNAGFDNALYDAGITKVTFGPLPINYGDSDLFTTVGSYAANALSYASTSENFWTTAFSAEIGVPSRPIVLGEYVVVLLPLEESSPDDTERKNIEDYYASSLSQNLESSISEVVLKNKKFKDRFYAVYDKLFTNG